MGLVVLSRVPVAQRLITRACCAAETQLSSQCITRPKQLFSTSTTSRTVRLDKYNQRTTSIQRQLALRRTYAVATPPPTPAARPISTTTSEAGSNLPWDTFFAIRRTRRIFGFASGVVGAIVAVTIGAPLIGQNEVDTQIAQAVGIDSIYALAGASILVLMSGYAAGRLLSSLSFATFLRLRSWGSAFGHKENSLLHRIKRYRADPSNSSPQNPIPDYYGEKIKNVAGYRQWLRDQRIYQKKMYRDKLPESG